ncbi:hypothetical protein V6N13_092360 [Hibiscus sabdariffa]
MESRKFALLLVAIAVVLLVATAPTVTAARNEVKPFSTIVNTGIRNPLANIFSVNSYKPARNCYSGGTACKEDSDCCSGSGLRQTFGRHGDVIDSFIAGKNNRAGFQLSVTYDKYKTRTSYWRKVNQKEPLQKQELGAKEFNQSKNNKVEKITNPIDSTEGTSSRQTYQTGEKELKVS